MLKEYDVVVTLVDKKQFPKGSKGVIVSIYSDNKACEVELWDEDNYPVDVVTYEFDEIEIVQS